MLASWCLQVVAMTSSKKTAYVANGEELDQPFEDNALLNRKSDFPFDDPPWKIVDTDVGFEPMVIKTADPTDSGSVADAQEPAAPTDEVATDAPANADVEDAASDQTEWAEVGTLEPVIQGVPEDEVTARIEAAVAEAVAKAHTETAEPLEARIAELEAALEAAQAETETVRTATREATEAEYQALLEDSRRTYDQLTEKLTHAADNVSEFFEPLSRLAVHVGCQLVRGELTVGHTAIARLVQGCLDALEGYQPKNPPVLRMHPEDLATYLGGIDGEPEGVQLRGDDTMARGDVSLQMDDTAVDDLIAHRLEALSNQVFGMGPTLSDAMFRTSFSNASETVEAFDDIDAFIDAEVLESDAETDPASADSETIESHAEAARDADTERAVTENPDIEGDTDSDTDIAPECDAEETPEPHSEVTPEPDIDMNIESDAEQDADAETASPADVDHPERDDAQTASDDEENA
jgi:flagellar biosynthesis/type III secretory pathway protein FliH